MRRQQKSCRFNGKELDEETGLYYFGARYYNPKRVLWYSTDPMELKHPNVTSYGYTMGNPVNAIDYEGQLIIFINGQHGGSGGSRAYWNGLDARIMNWVGDHKPMYVDGAMGGWKNTLLDGYNNNLLSRNRYASGYAKGRASAGDILSSLSGDESIKVITHSMGGAFGKGYIQGIIDYADFNGLDISDLIEFEIDLAPYQPTEQIAVPGVYTKNIQHYYDGIAGTQKMSGAKQHITRKDAVINEKSPVFMLLEHSVDSFVESEVKEYIPQSKRNSE